MGNAGIISQHRRDFLRSVRAPLAWVLFPELWCNFAGGRKAVVVTFGGGARDDETFMPDGQENIPHLLNELLPQGTFFTQVVNSGILGHYVATASIVTGVYETSITSRQSHRITRPSSNTFAKI